jgi:hypothetical protein
MTRRSGGGARSGGGPRLSRLGSGEAQVDGMLCGLPHPRRSARGGSSGVFGPASGDYAGLWIRPSENKPSTHSGA